MAIPLFSVTVNGRHLERQEVYHRPRPATHALARRGRALQRATAAAGSGADRCRFRTPRRD
jgi:hypothetical protein